MSAHPVLYHSFLGGVVVVEKTFVEWKPSGTSPGCRRSASVPRSFRPGCVALDADDTLVAPILPEGTFVGQVSIIRSNYVVFHLKTGPARTRKGQQAKTSPGKPRTGKTSQAKPRVEYHATTRQQLGNNLDNNLGNNLGNNSPGWEKYAQFKKQQFILFLFRIGFSVFSKERELLPRLLPRMLPRLLPSCCLVVALYDSWPS